MRQEFLVDKLIVAITFFFDLGRFGYLKTVLAGYQGIASDTTIYIITNCDDPALMLQYLYPLPTGFTVHFRIPRGLGHPYLLAWCHREILLEVAHRFPNAYFLYSEDDLLLTKENVSYWLQFREPLGDLGLFPSFFRVELAGEGSWFSTDCPGTVAASNQPIVLLDDGSLFLGMPNPYQGLYLLDPMLMREMVSGPSMSPDFGPWNIREKAAQGLTFVHVPQGFICRNVVRIDPDTSTVDRSAWVHHLPNTYVNDPISPFGSVPMDSLFAVQSTSGALESLPEKNNKDLPDQEDSSL